VVTWQMVDDLHLYPRSNVLGVQRGVLLLYLMLFSVTTVGQMATMFRLVSREGFHYLLINRVIEWYHVKIYHMTHIFPSTLLKKPSKMITCVSAVRLFRAGPYKSVWPRSHLPKKIFKQNGRARGNFSAFF